ncbi:MAG: RNA polymerase sigma factor [Gammaproteobacteria bacterium]
MHDSDPKELWRLFQECRSDLLRFFRNRVQCHQTAHDLCQEAFLRVFVAAEHARVENPRSYLFRTPQNLLINHYRDTQTRAEYLYELAKLYGDPVDHRRAESSALAQEALQRIDQALRELSPLCQRVFHLSRVQGLTQAAIAKQLGISRRTVEDNLRRALLHCARAVADG